MSLQIWDEDELGSPTGESAGATLLLERLWDDDATSSSAPFGAGSNELSIWDRSEGVVVPLEAFQTRLRDAEVITAPDHRRRVRPRTVAPRLLRYVTSSSVFLLLLLAADGIYVATQLPRELEGAAEQLVSSATLLESADIPGARESLEAALQDSEDAGALMDRPSALVAEFLPVIGPDARAASDLAEAGELSSRSGLLLAGVAEEIGLSGDELPDTLYDDGRVDLVTVRRVSKALSRATSLMTTAGDLLSSTPDPALDRVDRALEDARDQVRDVRTTTGRAATLFDSLPTLLGAGSDQRYLLAFQGLSEARATGGLVSIYGVLEAKKGKIELVDVGSMADVIPPGGTDQVAAPPWFENNYSNQSATTQFQQANVSPNFPAVSRVLSRMFETNTGDRIDGVIALDPVALGELLKSVGPLELPEWNDTITAENAAERILHDSYILYEDPDEQARYLADIVEAFWIKVSDGDLDATVMMDSIGELARTRHVKVFHEDGSVEHALRVLNVGGGYGASNQNVQLVFNNNYSVNKIDYFLERHVGTTIRLQADGSAEVQVAVELENTAPSGPPSNLLGPGIPGDEPGLNRMTLNVLLPRGATPNEIRIDGRKAAILKYADTDHPVVWNLIEIPAGATVRTVLTYTIPGAATISGDRGHFEMSFVPQTSVNDDSYEVRVLPPDGWAADGPTATSGTFDTRKDVELDFTRQD